MLNRRSFFKSAAAICAGLFGIEQIKKDHELGHAIDIPINPYACQIQSLPINIDLRREEMFELGRRTPYYRYVNFPVEVGITDIHAIN